jgi:hypothetical protein
VKIAGLAMLVLVGIWATASVDRCPVGAPAPPALIGATRATGSLRVGAAKVAVDVPYPVTLAGYGPWDRGTVPSAVPGSSMFARALTTEVDGRAFSVVLFDTLHVTTELRDALAAEQPHPVWISATHTHSSIGGFDRRLPAQLTAVGRFRPEVELALLTAGRRALGAARGNLQPVRLEVAAISETESLSVARTSVDVDRRLTAARFVGSKGVVAEWLLLAAHPTLVAASTPAVDLDWPGALAATREGSGGLVSFVFQSAVGNASVDRDKNADAAGFAQRLNAALESLDFSAVPEPVSASWAESEFPLPHPDATRLVPRAFAPLLENLMCAGTQVRARLVVLRLGPISLLLTPFEVTAHAAAHLEATMGSAISSSLWNGYYGYLEREDHVRQGVAESTHQYFPPNLVELTAAAARFADSAAKGQDR